MRNAITFVVHGGYGKTATSFLQDEIFSKLDGVLYLGKYQDRMIPPDFHEKYYETFPSLASVDDSYQRARNSAFLISSLGEIILRELKTKNPKTVILSNENLFDFGNYNAELNQILIWRLFKYIRLNYDKEINFKIMMTIRNQKDALKSFYSYDYSTLKRRFKTFEEFLDYGIENKFKAIFGGYHYDLVIFDLRALFGENCVRFFIYEKLVEDSKEYLNEIFNFIEISPNMEMLNIMKKVNKNSEGGAHFLREIKVGPLVRILLFLRKVRKHYGSVFKFLEKSSLFSGLKTRASSYLADPKKVKIVRKSVIKEFPSAYIEKIDDMYGEGNLKLSRELNVDLRKYGYSYGSYQETQSVKYSNHLSSTKFLE